MLVQTTSSLCLLPGIDKARALPLNVRSVVVLGAVLDVFRNLSPHCRTKRRETKKRHPPSSAADEETDGGASWESWTCRFS